MFTAFIDKRGENWCENTHLSVISIKAIHENVKLNAQTVYGFKTVYGWLCQTLMHSNVCVVIIIKQELWIGSGFA